MREEIIGRARLILGDCREVLPTLGEIDSLISDPPYGMAFQSNYRAEQHEKIANDENEELQSEAGPDIGPTEAAKLRTKVAQMKGVA